MNKRNIQKIWCFSAFLVLTGIISSFSVGIVKLRFSAFGFPSLELLCASTREQLASYQNPLYELIEYIRTKPNDANDLYLVPRQSEFAFYTQKPFVHAYDPRLVPFYQAKTWQEAISHLNHLHIRFLYIPYTLDPTIFNSFLLSLINDPALTTVEVDAGGYRLYRIKNPQPRIDKDSQIVPKEVALPLAYQTDMIWQNSENSISLRDWVKKIWGTVPFWYTGDGPHTLSPVRAFSPLVLKPKTKYFLESTATGSGLTQLFLIEYDAFGKKHLMRPILETILKPGTHTVRSQFQTGPHTFAFRLALKKHNEEGVHLSHLKIFELIPKIQRPNSVFPIEKIGWSHSEVRENWTQPTVFIHNSSGISAIHLQKISPKSPTLLSPLIIDTVSEKKSLPYYMLHLTARGEGWLRIFVRWRNVSDQNQEFVATDQGFLALPKEFKSTRIPLVSPDWMNKGILRNSAPLQLQVCMNLTHAIPKNKTENPFLEITDMQVLKAFQDSEKSSIVFHETFHIPDSLQSLPHPSFPHLSAWGEEKRGSM